MEYIDTQLSPNLGFNISWTEVSYLTSVFPQIIKQRKLLGWFIWEVEVITYTSTKYTKLKEIKI